MKSSIEEKEDAEVESEGSVDLKWSGAGEQQPGHTENNDEGSLFKLLSPSQWRSIWSARMAEDLSKIYGAAMLGSTCEFLFSVAV